MRKSIINISSGALGYVLPMALNLFFTPLIVKNLDSESYGLQSLVNVIIGFLMIADMGLDIPVTRSVADYKAQNNILKLNNLLNSTLLIYLLIGVFGLICLGALSPVLADSVFKIPNEFRERAVHVFYLAGIGFVGGLFSMWGKAIFNGFQRYEISNGISVISNLLSLIVGTILVVKGYGVVVYVLVRVVFAFLTGFAYLLVGKAMLKEFRLSFRIDKEIWDLLKLQIGYGFLLRISGIIVSRLDQILIGIWIGVSEVGFYAIPLLIVTSLTGLLNSMTHYLFPQMSELKSVGKEEDLKELFLKASRYIAMVTFAIYPAFIVFGGRFLFFWVGEELSKNSTSIFILLLVASIISTLFAMLINLYLVAIGNLGLFTKYILVRSTSMGIIMLILIKPFGLTGIGVAMISGGLLDAMFYFYIIVKYVKLNTAPLFFNLYPKLIVISVITGLILHYTYLQKINNLPTLFVGGSIYMLLLIALALIFKVFNQEEKKIFNTLKERIFKAKI